MKKFILKTTALAVLLCGNAAFAAAPHEVDEYSNVPFTNAEEQSEVKLADYKGKVVLLEFWAPWCKYCQRQMPAVSVLAEKYKDEPNFAVLPVSIDYRGEAPVKTFFRKKGIDNLGIFTDVESNLANKFGVKTIPTFLLLSKEGKVLSKFSGMQSYDDDLVQEHLTK
jgi:thiol-disulfide isomerase/thioredoxin